QCRSDVAVVVDAPDPPGCGRRTRLPYPGDGLGHQSPPAGSVWHPGPRPRALFASGAAHLCQSGWHASAPPGARGESAAGPGTPDPTQAGKAGRPGSDVGTGPARGPSRHPAPGTPRCVETVSVPGGASYY